MAALNKMGIPEKLVRQCSVPNTELEDWSIEGVQGKCPTARGGWQYEINKDKLFIYGGWEGEGKTRTYFDDVYMLDMVSKTWTQVFRNDIDTKLASSRYHVMVPGKEAPIVVAMAKGAVGDALEVVDTLDVGPMLDTKRNDFKEVMTAHVKEQLDDLAKLMIKFNRDLARGAKLQGGDIKTLKKVMGALKKVKDDGTNLQFQIDQLQETLTYMKLNNMGKVDPFERKLGDVREALEAAMSNGAAVKQADQADCRTRGRKGHRRDRAKEEDLEKQHAKLLQQEPFKISRHRERVQAELNRPLDDVAMIEQECQPAHRARERSSSSPTRRTHQGHAKAMRGDLVRSKALWDLTVHGRGSDRGVEGPAVGRHQRRPRSRRRRRPSRRSSRAWTRPCASGTSTSASTVWSRTSSSRCPPSRSSSRPRCASATGTS